MTLIRSIRSGEEKRFTKRILKARLKMEPVLSSNVRGSYKEKVVDQEGVQKGARIAVKRIKSE